MPFANPEDRRAYDRERRRAQREAQHSAPIVLPASARMRVATDVENLLGEAVRLVLSDPKARGTEKARALGYLCSIGLRLIESRDVADRLEALEEVIAARRSA